MDLLPIPTSLKFDAELKFADRDRILPPDFKPTAGRPKRKRIPSFGEIPFRKVKKFHCPNCTLMGTHDTTTCLAKMRDDVPNNQ